MCGLSSPLWSTDGGRCVARCLNSIIPSGESGVVSVRTGIFREMVGPGWCSKSRLAPIIDHPLDGCNSTHYVARVIYVGHTVGTLQCSPRVSPCHMIKIKPPNGGDLNFGNYCSMRADIGEFLCPLPGCHLIGPCSLLGLKCHARYLQSVCDGMV